MTAMLSKAALAQAFEASEEFKTFALNLQAKAAQTMGELHEVKSLGTSLTLPQIAQAYQSFKGLGVSFFGEFKSYTEFLEEFKSAGVPQADKEAAKAFKATPEYAEAEAARQASFAYAVSTECLAIIKKAGYKADTEGVKAIIAYEPKA